jgi:hypothetical protein
MVRRGASGPQAIEDLFVQWLFFGREPLIAENDRDRQRKLIKYNQLVANCLISHNVQAQPPGGHHGTDGNPRFN